MLSRFSRISRFSRLLPISTSAFRLSNGSIMAQKSITSFFVRASSASSDKTDKIDKTEKRNGAPSEDEDSPVKITKRKRIRIESDESDDAEDVNSKPTSPISSVKTEETKETDLKSIVTVAKSPSKIADVPPKNSGNKSTKKSKVAKSPKSATDKPKAAKNGSSKSPNNSAKNGDPIKTASIFSSSAKSENCEETFNPSKAKYHPIEDAFWQRDSKVPYFALAKTLEEIEKVSARLKIIEILSNYFRSVIALSPEDLLPSVYLCLNQLAPAFKSVELGLADTTLIKAIAQSTGRSAAQIKADCNAAGDIGIVAERSRSNQKMMFRPAPLTVRGVFDKLKEIATLSGQAAVSKKVDKIQALFVACRHSEARYLIRSLAGKLRIGLAEQSVLQALATASASTPPCFPRDEWPPKVLDASKGLSQEQFKNIIDEHAIAIKTAYCECPNYDLLIPTLLNHGAAELSAHCKLTPGIPLKPMLAHPTKGVSEVLQRFEGVEFTCEWKYDGERAQIHVPSKKVDDKLIADISAATIYSRNLENSTSKYPDVLMRLEKTLSESVTSCVLDCEAVAWDLEKKQIRPFQVLSTRKRKDAKDSEIKVAVCLFMFDLLYLNGEPLVRKPYEERRRLLKENFKTVEGEWCFASSLDCKSTETIQEFLEESIKGNCEGLMVKTLSGKDATYEIAKRSRNWLKLKKDYIDGVGDTIDAVVLGGYLGQGKRAGVYGGFLLACYDCDNEEYQSLCKIGTGFSDEDLQSHTTVLKEHIIDGPKSYYRYDSSLKPDHWFAPVKVWEVMCADLSLSPIHRAAIGIVDADKGISLRFPRFIRIRDDKLAEAATSAHQIADMYSNQDQVKNQAQNRVNNHEEDFY